MNGLAVSSLGEALLTYLQAHSGKKQPLLQDELFSFRRYLGAEKVVSAIAPLDIEKYCEDKLDGVGEDRGDRLKVTKDFLKYLFKEGFTESDLAPHAKLRRQLRRAGGLSAKQQRQATINQLTAEGHQRLQDELAALIGQRPVVIDAIRLARATKDISENAPYHAAREQLSQIEGRIKEVETVLRDAVILDESAQARANEKRVTVGSQFILKDSATGVERAFMLVDSSESNPSIGRVSDLSPIGKAVLHKAAGESIDVPAPKGTQRYLVAKIGA